MNTGDYLDALARLPTGPLAELVGRDPFLVCSPHPDDETLGCGGLILEAVAAGLHAEVVIVTDGSASHRASRAWPAAKLAGLRRGEAERAAAHLGLPIERLHFLALPDAATPGEGPLFDAAVADVTRIADGFGARTLFVTWGQDPHCDHETAFAMARVAARRLDARLWAYPIWGLHLPRDGEVPEGPPTGLRLDVARHRATKRRALDCYASQMTRLIDDDPDGFCFTEEQLAPFLRDHETFIAVAP